MNDSYPDALSVLTRTGILHQEETLKMDQDIQSVAVKRSRIRVRRPAGRPRKKYTSLAGQTRDGLTAKGKPFYVEEKSGKSYWHIKCRCTCGRTSTPRVGAFLSGHSKTCDHAARDRFMAHHDNEATQLSPALIEEMGIKYYPLDVQEYPDKHHRRYRLARMYKRAVATFDYAMYRYRKMRGWIVETVTKVALKVKAVVKTTARTIAQLANDARIGCMCREYRKLLNQPALKAKAEEYKSIDGKPPKRSFVKDAVAYFNTLAHREGSREQKALAERERARRVWCWTPGWGWRLTPCTA